MAFQIIMERSFVSRAGVPFPIRQAIAQVARTVAPPVITVTHLTARQAVVQEVIAVVLLVIAVTHPLRISTERPLLNVLILDAPIILQVAGIQTVVLSIPIDAMSAISTSMRTQCGALIA